MCTRRETYLDEIRYLDVVRRKRRVLSYFLDPLWEYHARVYYVRSFYVHTGSYFINASYVHTSKHGILGTDAS